METARDQENWRSLHERLRGIARRRAALDAEEARCLREAYTMKLWRQLGYAHMNEYLERELGYSPQVGIERLRVAHALGDLPRIEASLGAGHLAFSAVRELTRVATAETEQDWLDKVRGKNLREIESMVSGKKRGDRPEDPGNPDLILRTVRLELVPAVFALFRQVQSAMADEHGGRLDDSALIEVICRRALEGGGEADRPAYQLAITQCETCGRAWQNGAGREIDIGPEVVERAHCDAELIGPLDAHDPERVRTTVTPRVRRQVLARDHYRCTVPGCRSARNLDLHHIEYQSHGGGHEMRNLTTLCSAHHTSLHEGRLTISGAAPDALDFIWREHIGPEAPDDPASRGSDHEGDPEQPRVRPSPPAPSTPSIQPSPPVLRTPSIQPSPPVPRTPSIQPWPPARSTPSIQPWPPARSTPSIQPSPQARSTPGVQLSPPALRTPSAQPSPQAPSTLGVRPSPQVPSAGRIQLSPPAPSVRAQGSARRVRSAAGDPTDATRTESSPIRRSSSYVESPSPNPEVAIDASTDVSAATIDELACLALITAGYRSREARVAVQSARPHVGASATLEQVIREALRQCGSVAARFTSSSP